MKNYFPILSELKKATLEGNIDSFKQSYKNLIEYTSNEENQITWRVYPDDARNPIRSTNLVILTTKYNKVNILEYLFDPDTKILNNLYIIRTILPDDEDEEHHNAFYYAIRWSNIELLDTLINKWPDNYFGDHLEKLDEILSRAYEELQLKNVPLSNEIEIFVELKLINLRFFSNAPRNDDNFSGDLNINTIGRIEFMLQNISLLNTNYSKQEKVDGKFLYVAKSIAQNIHILKKQLRSTYDVLPWEEMEFCLVIFILSHIKRQEINLFYRATLNKCKILNHLQNFANKFEEQKDIIKGASIELCNLPKLQRAKVVAGIISNYPQFEELYKEYRQIRDVYSLEQISDSIKLALSVDPKETEGQLIITRVLQLIGEHLKNTLESPKLSSTTSDLFLLSLPKNTRQIIAGIRDSLSHDDSLSKRTEIEENSDINFFINIKNDIKKVGDVINDILSNNKIKIICRLLKKIVDGEDFSVIIDVSEVLNTVELDQMLPSTFKMLEHERLEIFLKDLSDNITEKTNYEQELLNEIHSVIISVGAQLENNGRNYDLGFTSLRNLSLGLSDNSKTDHNINRLEKSLANQILQKFTSKVEPGSLKKVAKLSLELLLSVESRMQKDKLDDVLRLIVQIHNTADFATGDIKWIEELSGKLNDKDSFVSAHKQRKTYNVTEGHQLTRKLSKLKTILSNYTSSGSLIIEKLLCYKRDRKIQAVVEMLVLDITSILGRAKLENNLLLLDDHTPVVTGKCLRDYLAHHNAVIDVLSSDPSIAVILNAEKLTEENLVRSKKKIGKVIGNDILKLKAKYNQDLVTITDQERMFAALEEGNMESLKDSLKNGADINGRNINLWTTLHFAAKGPSLEVVKFILDQNVSINLKNNCGQTPLHIAAAYGRHDIVAFFIKEAGLCVDVRNYMYKTPLHVAAQNGHKNTVEILLKNNADAVTDDIGGHSPLHYAIRNHHIHVAKFLLEKDVNIDINETADDCTPLHEAAEIGNLEVVNFLLCNKADVNAKTDINTISLHAAVFGGHEEVVNALIQKGADINARHINGFSALHYAAQNGDENIAKILLLHGANVEAADEMDRSTPLHYSAINGYLGIVKTLLIYEANANAANVHGITPLHFAVHRRHLDIIGALLEHEDVDIHAKDINNETPLHYAAASGHKEVAEILIKKIGNINGNNNYITTIHAAALKGHKDVVDLLIKNNAGVNARDTNTSTPLHAAAKNGSQDIIDLLIKNKAKINARTSDGMTPLHVAALNVHGNAVDFLIKSKAEVNAADNDGITPLFLAVIAGHKEVVEILAANEANVNIENKTCTPLICAVKNNHVGFVDVLLAKGANVNAKGGQAFLLAVFAGFTDIVNRFLFKDKNCVNMRNEENDTPLHIAARKGHKKIVKALLRRRADVESINTNNVTPLCLAAEGGHEVVVEFLLAGGANVNVRCYDDNYTPLHLAALNGHINVVRVLLDNQANINVKDNKNSTPIELAVAFGHLKVVVMLLEFNKEIAMYANSEDNFTLLHIASEGSNLELVKYLVENGFDINAKNFIGSKPIHIAASAGYRDTVEYFLGMGLNINDTDSVERTLLHYTSTHNHLELVKYLIAQGADVNAQAQSYTAMYIAAQFGYKDVIKVLLQNHAVYNAVDKCHRRPLNFTTDPDVINLLESTDKLFEAVKHNSSLEVKNYIKSGAFVNAKNVEGVTPLHYAAWKGYDEVVNVLLKNNANPNVVGNKGVTPLHYAAKFSHLNIIKALLSKYAVYNAVSDSGKTPSDFTVDADITSLFKLVNEAFEDIKNGNYEVVDYLNKITDIDTVKAVMCACDGENRTLVVAAVQNNFSQVNQLKEISQGDLAVHITKAVELLEQGNHRTALDIFESAWEKRKEILGSDNPGTLDIQTHIATVLYEQEDYSKALNILEEIFQKQKKMLGLNHKDTLSTRGTIASVLYRQGKDEEAFNIYQEVYQKQTELLGPDHRVTLCIQNNMAQILDSLGRYEEALNMIQTVFQKIKVILGSDHEATIKSQHNMAVVLSNQGKFEEALKMYEEVYEKMKIVLGANHSDTLRTLHNISGIFFKQQKYRKALKVVEELLNIQGKVLEPNHPDILNTRFNMANMLFDQDKLFGAFKAYKEILDLMKIVLGPSHRNVVNALKNIEVINSSLKVHGIEASKVLHKLQNDVNIAASNGDIQSVQRLLKDGADPNKKDIDGRTPLHCAVSYGHLSVMKSLLQNGADIARATNKVNTTLLHTATAKDCKEIVDVLLQHASRDKLNEFINAKTTFNGDTSLHIAVNNGALHIIKSLLKRGAIYNIKNNEGNTPLDLSLDQYENNFLKLVEELFEDAKSGNVQIIGELKSITPDDFKAVTNARNNKGNTLLQVAIDNKHKIVVNKLLEMLKLSDQGEQVNVSYCHIL